MIARVVDNGVTVRAEMDLATGVRGELAVPWTNCSGDRLRINGRDTTRARKAGRVEYSAIFDASTRDFEFELDRVRHAQILTSVRLPDSFEITAPSPTEAVSRAAGNTIAWTPPGTGTVRIEMAEEIGGGLCVLTDNPEHNYKAQGGVEVEDTGQWEVPAGVIASETDEVCDARYMVSRFAQGSYPEALAEGGFVEAQVLRAVVIVSEP